MTSARLGQTRTTRSAGHATLAGLMRLLCLPLLLSCACGDQDSSPVPQPVPGLIRQSTPGLTATQKLVVGLAGAVQGKGTVHLRDTITGKAASAATTGTGSFSLVLLAKEAQSLEAWFENDAGETSDVVTLATRYLGEGLTLGPPQPGVVSKPDAQGKVKVSNDGGASKPLLMTATPNVDVVVVNAASGAVALTKTDKDGRFTTTIAAKTGELIRILLVDPAQKEETSDFQSITVP